MWRQPNRTRKLFAIWLSYVLLVVVFLLPDLPSLAAAGPQTSANAEVGRELTKRIWHHAKRWGWCPEKDHFECTRGCNILRWSDLPIETQLALAKGRDSRTLKSLEKLLHRRKFRIVYVAPSEPLEGEDGTMFFSPDGSELIATARYK